MNLGLRGDLALGEEHRGSWASSLESFLNGDVAPLGVNFGKQIECLEFLLFISRSCWLWTRFVPIYFCGVFLCARPLAGYSRNYRWTFDSNTFLRFSLKLVIRSNSYSRRKFLQSVGSSVHRNSPHRVGNSDRQICYEEIFRFFTGSPIHPPLGITKILSPIKQTLQS